MPRFSIAAASLAGALSLGPQKAARWDPQVGPEETLAALFLRINFGLPALFVFAPSFWLLQDAQERGQLGVPVFRALCLAAGVATCGVDAWTAQGLVQIADALAAAGGAAAPVDTVQLPNLVSALAIAGLQAGVFFFQALKPDKGATPDEEEVVLQLVAPSMPAARRRR